MTNPYTTQTIADYNTSPPADDASAVASNQLFWSKHKDKLADPIKTLAEAIDTQNVAAHAKFLGYATNAQSTTYSIIASDEWKIIECTGTFTLTLLAAVTAGDGFTIGISNVGTGVITVEGDTSELVGGATNQSLAKTGDSLILQCNGTNHKIVADSRTSYEVAIDEAKGADIASATTTDIGAATGNYINVTGTTTITGLGTVQAGARRVVQFDGVLTLTHNATSLILPTSDDILTVAGDVAEFVSLGSGNWKCTNYERQDGTALLRKGPTVETAQVTTSGTTFNYTGINAAVRKITVIFEDVSLSGTDDLFVQIGDAGGLEITGYTSTSTTEPALGARASTVAFAIQMNTAANSLNGTMTLYNISDDGLTWVESHVGSVGATASSFGGGSKTLSAALDRVTIKSSTTNTFDSGSINIFLE